MRGDGELLEDRPGLSWSSLQPQCVAQTALRHSPASVGWREIGESMEDHEVQVMATVVLGQVCLT